MSCKTIKETGGPTNEAAKLKLRNDLENDRSVMVIVLSVLILANLIIK